LINKITGAFIKVDNAEAIGVPHEKLPLTLSSYCCHFLKFGRAYTAVS